VKVITDLDDDFPANLRRLRLAAGLTQEALAERIGSKQEQISALERGKTQPTYNTLKRLAAALGVHPSALLLPRPEEKSENRG